MVTYIVKIYKKTQGLNLWHVIIIKCYFKSIYTLWNIVGYDIFMKPKEKWKYDMSFYPLQRSLHSPGGRQLLSHMRFAVNLYGAGWQTRCTGK